MTDALGTKLIALKERSGLSLTNIAKAAGYRSASSIQRYFSPDFEAEYLSKGLADRLRQALVGFGDPAIIASDIDQLTEYGFMYLRQSTVVHIPARIKSKTIECFPSYGPFDVMDSLFADFDFMSIGGEPIKTLEKPEKFAGRQIWAFYNSSVAMRPRFEPGDMVFVEHERPVRIGQDAIIYIDGSDEGEPPCTLVRVVELTRDSVVVETHTPSRRLEIPRQKIALMEAVLGFADLLPDA